MASRPSGAPLHVVLLAGGSGTRFWPLSRAARPKQLLELGGKGPLLVRSWKRVRKLGPPRRLWVVAPTALAPSIRRMLPELSGRNLIVEPSPRDTAPAIALACATISERDPDAVTAVFPTDHIVRDEKAFVRSVKVAVGSAKTGALVCLGIRPTAPSTGFGYLQCSRLSKAVQAVPVRRFVEKPDAARARRFLRSGKYLWNAGMFVWTVSDFLEELERSAPAILKAVQAHLAGRPRAWARAPRISVDYAVMEKARKVRVVPLEAGWDDVGSWDAAARYPSGSPSSKKIHVLIDSEESAVFGETRFVGVVGVPGIVVVDTPDALLVVSREHSEKVKEIVDQLRRRGRLDLL